MGSPAEPTAWATRSIITINCKSLTAGDGRALEIDGGLSQGASDKEPTCQGRSHKRHRFDPWVRKIPWKRK